MPAKRREERDVGDSEYGGMSSPDAPTSYPGDIDEQPAGAPQSSDQSTYDMDDEIKAAGAAIGAVVGATVGSFIGAESGPTGAQLGAIAGQEVGQSVGSDIAVAGTTAANAVSDAAVYLATPNEITVADDPYIPMPENMSVDPSAGSAPSPEPNMSVDPEMSVDTSL